MRKAEEFAVKMERVQRCLAENGLGGVILARGDNFAWLGCGANNLVDNSGECGVGTLAVQDGKVTLIASNIETERLLSEELSDVDIEGAEVFPWYEPAARDMIIERLCAGARFAADDGSLGLPPLPDGFARLRYQLTAAEVARYQELGRDSAAAIEAAARAVQRGMTEAEVAALLLQENQRMGIALPVVLVAADERIRSWRHPIVKRHSVEEYVMLIMCGRRQGLIAAATRLVHFGQVPEELQQRHHAVCHVDAAMIAATVPGRPASEVFVAAQGAYARAGFPDEWQHHHQGGGIGYKAREYIANAGCAEIIQTDQAFAWNPSICGTKSEDTILAGEEGFALLTAPAPDWPTVPVEIDGQTIRRADILVK